VTAWTKPCSLGNCPEYRYVGGRVEIRDSARPHEVAWFRPEAWTAFVAHLRAEEPLSASESAAAPRTLHGYGPTPDRPATTRSDPQNHARVTRGGDA
jgi:hypothetical protein